MSASNPVTRRLDLLFDQWIIFAQQPDARILRWMVQPDEVPMVRAFVEIESDERTAELPDAFLELEASFQAADIHGQTLRTSLIEQYEAAREPLAKDGVSSLWQPPPVGGNDDVTALIMALDSFQAVHGPENGVFAVWLVPRDIQDRSAYEVWLGRLAVAAPPALRFIVLDSVAAPGLDKLAEALPKPLVTVVADLDMDAAMAEVSSEAGGLDEPGGRFRHLVLAIGAAGKRGDMDAVHALGAQAVAVAQAAGLLHLVFTAHFLIGALEAKANLHPAAVQTLVAAEAAGAVIEASDPDLGKRLRLNARLAQGSSLVAMAAFAPAAQLYTETIPLTEAAADKRASLDCWRMASYCLEQLGKLEEAFASGWNGWNVGLAMDIETRKTSTIAYLAEQLMRQTTKKPLLSYARSTEEKIVALLGPRWRPDPKASPPAATNDIPVIPAPSGAA